MIEVPGILCDQMNTTIASMLQNQFLIPSALAKAVVPFWFLSD